MRKALLFRALFDFPCLQGGRQQRSPCIWFGCTNADHCCLQDDFKNELAAQKVFLQGPDKHGRGVIILKVSRHSKTKRDLEETKRLICHTLDHQVKLHDLRLNPDAKGVGIFDLRGTGLLVGPCQKPICCAFVSSYLNICTAALDTLPLENTCFQLAECQAMKPRLQSPDAMSHYQSLAR